MPKGFKAEDHFDHIEKIGRNPFHRPMPDGTTRHETDLIVDRGIQFIKNQPADQPFALNMWFNAAHAEDSDRRPGTGHFPWPESANGLYDDLEMYPPKLNDPEIFESQPDFLKISINRERYFWRWNTPEKYQTNMRAYLRMISGIDNAIGRFTAQLEELGLADNTIIIYSADNGYHMGNRGFAGKWSHYEESLRVPLIIMDPRVKKSAKGQNTDLAALNLDLPATFLDWAGADIPSRYQGHSLKAIIDGEQPAEWRTETFHEHYAVRHRIPAFEGIRTADFKYVRYFDHDNHEFLHDLANDPDELTNLATDPAYSDTLAAMRQRTTDRVQQLGGPLNSSGNFNNSTLPNPDAAASMKDNLQHPTNLIDAKMRQWAGDKKYWSVEENQIVGRCDGKMEKNRFLTWKGNTIQNFDLTVQVKITKGGNSGIQYRSQSLPAIGPDIVGGYQCDIVADQVDYNGMFYEERGRGILAKTNQRVIVDPGGKSRVISDLPQQNFPSGQWHTHRILVEGNHHRHWINGHLTADALDLDTDGHSLEGVLALQVHKGPEMEVRFKNMRIIHLPDNLPLKTEADFLSAKTDN
ncbi:MAG: family 16 glycoside hydrolase, partial [Verrucomicrobiota bacterium]